MPDTAIVFLAHTWSEAVARRFERLWRETSPSFDCFALIQDDDANVLAQWQSSLKKMGAERALFGFSAAKLPAQLDLRYFGLRQVLSNAHFPLLLFSRSHRYSSYWQIEYDVELRGPWRDFFELHRPSEAALIAAHFHRWSDWPGWFWWPSLMPPANVVVSTGQLFKAFMPVARYSQEALHVVERAHREGWLGHFEAVVPTVLMMNGHNLEDLNVRGKSYIGGFQDPVELLPLLSSVRARPPVGRDEFRNRGQGALLFHPVKEDWVFDGKDVNPRS